MRVNFWFDPFGVYWKTGTRPRCINRTISTTKGDRPSFQNLVSGQYEEGDGPHPRSLAENNMKMEVPTSAKLASGQFEEKSDRSRWEE
jgi:hypothetical protein